MRFRSMGRPTATLEKRRILGVFGKNRPRLRMQSFRFDSTDVY
jgi:hypothetical protein